jgi:hypothetical protein
MVWLTIFRDQQQIEYRLFMANAAHLRPRAIDAQHVKETLSRGSLNAVC